MNTIKALAAIRGTQDIFGDDQRAFHHVVRKFDHLCGLYGFDRVEMPVFESTAVFARSLGETTDVVSKEMYSFDDRSGDNLTLRPEFTAGIARAFLSNGWQQHAPMKIATHGPLFRYERPQKGRYRQFHQIDAEIIGAPEVAADAELLIMADHLLQNLGISRHITLQLNTLGDAESREAWRDALVAHFTAHKGALSAELQDRLERNPLRILDSKSPQDREIAENAPDIDQFLTDNAGQFFEDLCALLDKAKIAWTRNSRLVRGLDYYRHTAFEFVTDALGAQGTVLGGGRYDGLIENLGGNATPAVGWAAGIERLAMLAGAVEKPELTVALIPMGKRAEQEAIGILADLRRADIHADMTYKGNMKKRMAKANQANAHYAIIIGDNELDEGKVALKNMRDGHQEDVALAGLVEKLTA